MTIELVEKSLRQHPLTNVDGETLRYFINRELAPLVNEIRARLNEAIPATYWSPTDIQTADYTAAIGEMVLYDASGGTFAVHLPSPSSTISGRGVWVKEASGNATGVTVSSSALIDGSATKSVSGAYGSHLFYATSTTWYSVGAFISL